MGALPIIEVCVGAKMQIVQYAPALVTGSKNYVTVVKREFMQQSQCSMAKNMYLE